MKVYNSINIRLQFRTHEQNGLIFYNAGKASDFIALELVKGRLYYILNLGYGPIAIKDDMVRNTTTYQLSINYLSTTTPHKLVDSHEVSCTGWFI